MQTVTVSATQNAATAKVTLAHAVAGADYGSVTAEPVVVSHAVGGADCSGYGFCRSAAEVLQVPEGGERIDADPDGDLHLRVELRRRRTN